MSMAAVTADVVVAAPVPHPGAGTEEALVADELCGAPPPLLLASSHEEGEEEEEEEAGPDDIGEKPPSEEAEVVVVHQATAEQGFSVDDAASDSPKPNDEQLVAQLTSGTLSMTDQVSVCAQLGFRTTAKDHGHVGGLLAGKIGSNKFVADYAVDSRAKCRDTKCNAYILQSDLRIGKIPPSVKTGHSCRTHWYHLNCIFRSFRRACKGTKIITNVADVANFDRLRREDQDQIRLCIQCAKNSRDRGVPDVNNPPQKNGGGDDEGTTTTTTKTQNNGGDRDDDRHAAAAASVSGAGAASIITPPPSSSSSSSLSLSLAASSSLSSASSSSSSSSSAGERTMTPLLSGAASKRKSDSSSSRPNKKERVMDSIGPSVSAHEVESILGLTMLSRDKSTESETPPSTPQEKHHPTAVAITPPAVAPPPLAILERRHSDSPANFLPNFPVAFPRAEATPPRASKKDSATRWRPPGSTCEVLYHDQWHVGVVERYTESDAVIRFDDDVVRVNLVSEKHRVCWNIGAMTNRSNFA